MYNIKELRGRGVLTKLGILMMVVFLITLFSFPKEAYAAVTKDKSGWVSPAGLVISITADFPALGVANKALVVVTVAAYLDGNSCMSGPSGWTLMSTGTVGVNGCGRTYYKLFSGAPAAATWVGTQPFRWALSWTSFTNVSSVEYKGTSGGSSPANPPSKTASKAVTSNDMWVTGHAGRFRIAHITPSGYTIGNRVSGNSSTNASTYYKVGTGSATENPGATISGDQQYWTAITVAAFGVVYQCSDGSDNDSNGLTDWPADLGCSSATDNTESGYTPQCNDTNDNDLNGLTDWPADLGCSSATDNTESGYTPQCNDTNDNDLNGLTDWPADLGCSSATDNTESGYIPTISGALISSTFDTGVVGGAKLNSILWQGSLGVGGTNSVKFQIASSDCANGATDAGTCAANIGWGGSKSSGDGALIGSDGTSLTFYTPTGPNFGYAIPVNHHNNKRYFRYRVQLDKDESSTSPVVNDIIINWSP